MEKFEILKYYQNFTNRINDLIEVLKPDQIQQQINEYEELMSQSNFWDDTAKATKILQECNDLKEKLKELKEIQILNNDIQAIIELNDESLYEDIEETIHLLEQKIEKFEVTLLLNGPYDSLNAIMELHPGAGGTESQDWALMLFRMYKRYCEKSNFVFELLDYQEAIDAGIKSVTFLVKGKNAYGTLKSERGVHRLVRISPFDSNARRHTSFVGCNVTPEFDNNINIEINPEDLKIDTYRSSGAGGQHVNTTDSAVRITHLPTGIVVSCQNERSQIQNRERAMQILKSKIYQKLEEERLLNQKQITGEVTDNGWGSQIRSYILQPYSLVKDHRTNFESTNPSFVLDGNIDEFINAYLKKSQIKGD